MQWTLKIEEPQLSPRLLTLDAGATLGKSAECQIPLADPSLPALAAQLCVIEEPKVRLWISIAPETPQARLGSLEAREFEMPYDLPVRLGQTRLTLLRQEAELENLPRVPRGSSVQAWSTASPAGRTLLMTAFKAAQTPLSLYLEGETGTGKEVLAHLLHAWSKRNKGPFVALNCAALTLSLAESELFGHTKGAFTGAFRSRSGALLQAHGGTLFLDEIGDLSHDIQVKLLRFLENGEIRPVGSDSTLKSEVRLICATHRPLERLVSEGKFRQDLYFRLASITLKLPPLRDRPADVRMLSERFAADFGKVLAPEAGERLLGHSWPGNVRELRHAIERAAGMAESQQILLGTKDFEFLETSVAPSADESLNLREVERRLLARALEISHGNRAQAARLLGVARSTLFEMLRRHRLREETHVA
jgi:DNA-binding NtrC family response regulator